MSIQKSVLVLVGAMGLCSCASVPQDTAQNGEVKMASAVYVKDQDAKVTAASDSSAAHPVQHADAKTGASHPVKVFWWLGGR